MLHPVDGIEMQTHRYRLRTYTNCYVGSVIVDWFINRDKAASRYHLLYRYCCSLITVEHTYDACPNYSELGSFRIISLC